MDVIRTIYKELFNIQFVHHAYELGQDNTIFKQLNVVPDENTKKLFARHDIDYRFTSTSVVCFIRSELISPPAKEPKKPYVLFETDFVIRFLVTVQPAFLNSTYVTATGSKNVYYFTNKINNIQSSNHYLSKSVEAYDASKDYDAGTIVSNAGDPYVTLQPVFSTDAIAITNTAYWKKINPLEQVVNNADLAATSLVQTDQPCFAVVDIYNTGTTNATYNLFGVDQQLLSPVYVIPFKSKI